MGRESKSFTQTLSMRVTKEEYKVAMEKRFKDGYIRSTSDTLRDMIIPILMNGNGTKPHIENKIESIDNKQDDEKVTIPTKKNPLDFDDVTF